MAETDISENVNTCLSPEQISAVRKALFVNWLLNYAKAYPDKFPEKPGRIIHQSMGNPGATVAMLSKDEILAWYNRNRMDEVMTEAELDVILGIQTANGIVVVEDYYTLLY